MRAIVEGVEEEVRVGMACQVSRLLSTGSKKAKVE